MRGILFFGYTKDLHKKSLMFFKTTPHNKKLNPFHMQRLYQINPYLMGKISYTEKTLENSLTI